MRIETTDTLILSDGQITHLPGDIPDVPEEMALALIDSGRARPFRPRRRSRVPGCEPVILDVDLTISGRGSYHRGQVADLPTHTARQLVAEGHAAPYYPPDTITITR